MAMSLKHVISKDCENKFFSSGWLQVAMICNNVPFKVDLFDASFLD